ncbi:MAG TPA: hypothetical protein VHY22_15195, partial [Chthoniobacteraceae bacterium]|nr:hypothetical protein [Chthoniobacteraceae bacterium]
NWKPRDVSTANRIFSPLPCSFAAHLRPISMFLENRRLRGDTAAAITARNPLFLEGAILP